MRDPSVRDNLDDVLITAELARRPARPPDYEGENRALASLAQSMAASAESVLQRLVEASLPLCHADSAGVTIVDPEGDKPVFRWHVSAGALAEKLVGDVFDRAELDTATLLAGPVQLLHRVDRHLPAFRHVQPPTQEMLLAPFHQGGKPAGSIWAISHAAGPRFDAEDARLLGTLARFAAAAYQMLTTARNAAAACDELEGRVRGKSEDLRESQAQLAAELAAMKRLHELISRLLVCPDLRTALNEVLSATVEITGADMGTVQLVDEHCENLRLVAQRGFHADFIRQFQVVHAHDAFACCRAARERRRVIIEDVNTDPGYEPYRAAAAAAGFRAVESTPLLGRYEQALGVLSTHYRQPHRPSERELRILDLYTRQAAEFMERTRAEGRLREKEEQFRAVVQGARGFAMFTMDPDGVITTWNPAAEALLGWTEKEAVGQPSAIIFTPEDRASGRPDEEMILARRQGRSLDERWHVKRDGSRFWGSGELTPAFGLGGEIRGFVKVMRDETARKQAEDRLRESEERLRVALASAEMGTWLWRIRDDEQILDTSLRRLMGLQPGQTLHSLEGFLRAVHEEDRDRVRGEFERCRREMCDLNVEFRVVWPDGSVHWLRDRGKTFPGPDGRPLFMTGACVDVTERKRMEDDLREADRRKDEFLAMLGHELRNPLAPLRGVLETLRVHRLEEQSLTRAYAMMERQVVHLTRLVDDLLDVSRITSGLIELRKEPVDLREVAEQAVEMASPAISSRGHKLSVTLPRTALRVEGDATRLTQVIFNLLSNAAKYTDPGGRIWLSVERDGQAVVRVRDNGSGIKPELLPRVFDLFTQGERTLDRSQGGLGLGLTLVKRLVEMHGGTVEARSDGPAKGTEFILHLRPLPAEPGEAPPLHPPNEPAAPASVDRALVVDDNFDVAESIAWMLEDLARDVKVAQSGPAAVETARSWRPDIILCDVGMPGMDGYETCRRLRDLPGLKTTLIAAVSGYGGQEDRRKSKEAGFDLHLVKPIGRATLADLVRAAKARQPH